MTYATDYPTGRGSLDVTATTIKPGPAGSGATMSYMTVAADTFADFVDHLAEALDDHEVSGEEWARRLHFSRYHFDRMIRSVAGEPPAGVPPPRSCWSGRRTA